MTPLTKPTPKLPPPSPIRPSQKHSTRYRRHTVNLARGRVSAFRPINPAGDSDDADCDDSVFDDCRRQLIDEFSTHTKDSIKVNTCQ